MPLPGNNLRDNVFMCAACDGGKKPCTCALRCQCGACKIVPHASDCAVHNEPAYPAGPCSCGANAIS